jgi:hypothetical protein
MRALIALSAVLCFAPAVQAQLPYIYQPGYAGPIAPYTAVYVPTYYRAYPAYGYGGYGGGHFYREESLRELRAIRYELEEANWRASWRR